MADMAGLAAGSPPVANDPGCVKTPQARERLELFFPDRPKSIAHKNLRSEIRNRKDDPFYQISTPPRFHTTKTRFGHHRLALHRGTFRSPVRLRPASPLFGRARMARRARLSL